MSASNTAIEQILKKNVDPRKLMYGLNIIQQPLVPNADYYLKRFDNESGPPAFTNISKIDIKSKITKWLASRSDSIDQSNASLCGPAAFFSLSCDNVANSTLRQLLNYIYMESQN